MEKRSKQERCALIYALIDPREPNDIRYIGRSSNGMHRPRSHFRDIGGSTWVENWIRALSKESIIPHIIVLEYLDNSLDDLSLNALLNEREVFWISQKRSEGHRLTNMTDGGAGMLGLPEESRRKIGDKLRGRRFKQTCGRRHPWFGKKLSEEILSKRRGRKQKSETISKRVEKLNKPVIVEQTGQRFISAKQAAMVLGIKYSTVKAALKRGNVLRKLGIVLRYE